MTKEELEKSLYFVNEERERLQQELERKDNIINEIEKELWNVRKITFSKYKSNEWNNCLSFNDDIEPIIDKLKKLKKGNKE